MAHTTNKEAATTEAPPWHIYMIKTRLDTLYTGVTTDVARRFKEHCSGNKRSARYLKGKGPLELVWHQVVGTKSAALQYEYRVKQLSKAEKQRLISENPCVEILSETLR